MNADERLLAEVAQLEARLNMLEHEPAGFDPAMQLRSYPKYGDMIDQVSDEGGGIRLTGDVWLLGKKHTYDPTTTKTYILGYADTNKIALADVVAEDMPPNVFVRKLANEQGDIYMGC